MVPQITLNGPNSPDPIADRATVQAAGDVGDGHAVL